MTNGDHTDQPYNNRLKERRRRKKYFIKVSEVFNLKKLIVDTIYIIIYLRYLKLKY